MVVSSRCWRLLRLLRGLCLFCLMAANFNCVANAIIFNSVLPSEMGGGLHVEGMYNDGLYVSSSLEFGVVVVVARWVRSVFVVCACASQCCKRMLRLSRRMVSVVSIFGRLRSRQNFSPSPRMLVMLGGGCMVVQRLWKVRLGVLLK